MLNMPHLEGLFGNDWIKQKNGDLVKDLKTGKLVVRQKIRMDSNFSGYISLYINADRKPIQVRSYSWRRLEGFKDAVNAMSQFMLNMDVAALHAIPHSFMTAHY